MMNHQISIRWSTRFMMKLLLHLLDWDTTTWKKMILKQHFSRKRRKRLAIERSPYQCAIWRVTNSNELQYVCYSVILFTGNSSPNEALILLLHCLFYLLC
ncbi:unnamed protein product [Musa acuminata subsp. burmannicoides]